jgi:hypothetical protein
MRVCLSAIAAMLLVQCIFAQEEAKEEAKEVHPAHPEPPKAVHPAHPEPPKEVHPAHPGPPAQPKTNADFKTIEEYDATPVVSPLEMNQDFQVFSWGGENPLSSKSFVFELHTAAHFLLTDYKQNGDSFQVYDNGELIGATRAVNATSAYAETPEDAVADKSFSKAAFSLAAGAHNITIEATSPYDFGSGAVRLVPNRQTLYKSDDDDHKDEEDHNGDDEEDHSGDDDDNDGNISNENVATVTHWLNIYSTITTYVTVHTPHVREEDRNHYY